MKVAPLSFSISAILALFAAGCSTVPQRQAMPQRAVPVHSERAAFDSVSTSQPELPSVPGGDRRIEAGDILSIEVLGELEQTGERRVQASGIIIYSPLGIVPVAGRTTTEVAEYIADRLHPDYLLDPKVSVEIKEYRLQTVAVMGFVEQAGAVKLPSEYRMDILEAIAEAGGFSLVANKNKIDLTRAGKTRTYSFEDLRKVTDPTRKVWLQPGDVIYVHQSIF